MTDILHGDAREMLATIPDESVQCVVTSPPYFGLRDYGHDAQIGLEPTVAEYVQSLVDVFRGVRRVLKDDGTLWLNLGDSYSGAGYGNHAINGEQWLGKAGLDRRNNRQQMLKKAHQNVGIKPKDLIGIPWRVAFALQADGWYLRQDLIWSKPNPMPESVKDRCTKSHEYMFLLTKSPKYYYDAEAISEPHTTNLPVVDKSNRSRNRLVATSEDRAADRYGSIGYGKHGRNKRSVWTISTRGYKGAHFAVFPEALVEPCILAGSRTGDTVLDPFMGSGTTLAVAHRLGRKGVGVELNSEYIELAKARLAKLPMPLPLGDIA